jgi:hypothetical protein
MKWITATQVKIRVAQSTGNTSFQLLGQYNSITRAIYRELATIFHNFSE